MLELKNLTFGYKNKEIFKDFNSKFEKGKSYAIVGDSGSGKTTLISILGGLTKIHNSMLYFDNVDINKIGLSKYKNKHVSIIFQDYNLIDYLNV